MTGLAAVLAGFFVDLLIGDPRWIPHPVVGMGKAISRAEPFLRRAFPDTPSGRRAAGRVLAAALPLACGVATWLALFLCGLVHPAVRFVVEAWLCCQLFATCELRRQSMAVVLALRSGGITAARTTVGRIVGRDVESLDEAGVLRAAVETVAENANDGVVAPLAFMMLGGAPLGMAYKAVNTLDSMVGYKNERYRDFGRASARLDDAANWIPARFAALCLVAAAVLPGYSVRDAWRVWRRDRRKHASPNSAQTEAAMAGALRVRLAGPASYFGVLADKPTIGDDERPIEPADVGRANRLMLAASFVAVCACSVVRAACALALG